MMEERIHYDIHVLEEFQLVPQDGGILHEICRCCCGKKAEN
jgi:hypothetical protein